MTTTKNLGLKVHGVAQEDLALTFLAWRQQIEGTSGSNMTIIDEAIGEIREKAGGFEFALDPETGLTMMRYVG